jgi:hypothetical protein
MVPLSALWLAILLSAVIVFVASSIIHMVLPYHKSNYKSIPTEEAVTSAVAAAGLQPGLYIYPYCTHKDMKTPAVQEKFARGPVGFLIARPNGFPNMGKFMGLWFVFCVLVSFVVAYLTAHTVGFMAPYRHVFRAAGTAAFLAYGIGGLSNGIWKGFPWSMVLKEAFDGLIYALLTAGVFGWLWPR